MEIVDRDGTLGIEVDGAFQEVNLPDGYLSPSEVREYVPKDVMESTIKRRLARARDGLVSPDEVLGDEEFLKRVAQEKGDALRELLGAGGGSEVDLDKARQGWEQTHVKPLKDQLTEVGQEVERLRGRALEAEVERAAREAGVHPEMVDFLKPYIRDQVAYDPEHGGWYVRDGEDFRYTTGKIERNSAPYMGVGEYLEELRASGKRDSWFQTQARGGGGFQGSRGRSGVTLEEFNKMGQAAIGKLAAQDPEAFNRLMAEKRSAAEAKLGGGLF